MFIHHSTGCKIHFYILFIRDTEGRKNTVMTFLCGCYVQSLIEQFNVKKYFFLLQSV